MSFTCHECSKKIRSKNRKFIPWFKRDDRVLTFHWKCVDLYINKNKDFWHKHLIECAEIVSFGVGPS